MDSTEGSLPTDLETWSVDELGVTAHRSAPDRTVFTERGNKEGWISSDFTVDLRE